LGAVCGVNKPNQVVADFVVENGLRQKDGRFGLYTYTHTHTHTVVYFIHELHHKSLFFLLVSMDHSSFNLAPVPSCAPVYSAAK